MSDKSKGEQFKHTLKKEFRRKNCGFDHDEPDSFLKSQWQNSSRNWFYLIYRWATATFFIVAVTMAMSSSFYAAAFFKYFVYLTNWGMLLCLVTHLIGATLVTIWHFSPDSADVLLNDSSCSPLRIYWILHTLALPISMVITILYWGLLYTPGVTDLNADSVLDHAFNSVFMTIDLWIVAHPIRLVHVFLPIAVLIVYPTFSFIYQTSGGTNSEGQAAIYPVLNWDEEHWRGTLIMLVGVFFILIAIFICIFLMSKLRRVLYRVYCQKQTDTVLPSTVYDINTVHAFTPSKYDATSTEEGIDNAAFTQSNEITTFRY